MRRKSRCGRLPPPITAVVVATAAAAARSIGLEVLDLLLSVNDGLHGDPCAIVFDLVDLFVLDIRDLLSNKLVGFE